jgi:hypothetical protein
MPSVCNLYLLNIYGSLDKPSVMGLRQQVSWLSDIQLTTILGLDNDADTKQLENTNLTACLRAGQLILARNPQYTLETLRADMLLLIDDLVLIFNNAPIPHPSITGQATHPPISHTTGRDSPPCFTASIKAQ